MRQRPGAPVSKGCLGCPAEFDPCLWSGSGNNPAHLIVVSSNPSGFSIGRDKAFFGSSGRLFRRLMDRVKQYQQGKYADIQIYTTYAVLVGAVDPNAEHIHHCQHNLFRELAKVRGVNPTREPVIVAIGMTALKALGIRATKITSVVGRELSATIPSASGPRTLKVIPIFDMKSVSSKPGLTSVVVAALVHAARMSYGEVDTDRIPMDVLTKDYVFPQTIDEVKKLVTDIINYSNANSQLGPENWLIALDTETNTLYPDRHPDPQVLMVSVAWDDGKAAAILLDHKLTPYSSADAWQEVARLLRCPKPKTFHNWKFDRKFLVEVRGIPVNNVVWCTLCGEHFIDEDKKGLYGLKKLAAIYTPNYTGYDDELQDILRASDDTASGNILPVTESDILLSYTVAPEGRDQNIWDHLREVIKTRVAEKAKAKGWQDQKIIGDCAKEIVQLYKRLDLRKIKRVKLAVKDVGYEEIPLEVILRYAAIDADVTRMIAKVQTHRLVATNTRNEATYVMRYTYLPASCALGDMEFRGFNVDLRYLTQLEQDVGALLWKAETDLKQNFGAINYRSIPQVMAMLAKLSFERIPGADGTSTDKEVLERYVSYYPVGDPRRLFAESLLVFRAADKAAGSFLKGIRKMSAADGRVHCNFNLTGTATGRLSSSDPNMQNVSKVMCRSVRKNPDGTSEELHPGFNTKKLFIPYAPDSLIVNVDIKGAELRVYTAYSHDAKMIKALLDGLDVHSFTASKIYGIPYDQIMAERYISKRIAEMRDRAKRVVFGTFYGAGASKIAEQINDTKAEAQRIMDLLFTEFPDLLHYIEHTKAEVHAKQMVKTHFGRFRRFRLAHASKEHMADATREAVNFLIQSTASDLVLNQLCEIAAHQQDIDGKLLITVHDSMTLEVPKSRVNLETRTDDKGKKRLVDTKGDLHKFFDHWIVERVAQKYSWLPVPFLYDIEIGPSYGELKEVHRG